MVTSKTRLSSTIKIIIMISLELEKFLICIITREWVEIRIRLMTNSMIITKVIITSTTISKSNSNGKTTRDSHRVVRPSPRIKGLHRASRIHKP